MIYLYVLAQTGFVLQPGSEPWLFWQLRSCVWKSPDPTWAIRIRCPRHAGRARATPGSGELAQSISQGMEGTGGLLQPPMSLRPLRNPQPRSLWAPRVCSARLDSPAWPLCEVSRHSSCGQWFPLGVQWALCMCVPSRASVPLAALRVQLMQPGP